MACHAQRQGFDALQNEPSRVGAHARTKVAQAFAAGAEKESPYGAFFREHHVVKAFVGLCEFGEFALCVGA